MGWNLNTSQNFSAVFVLFVSDESACVVLVEVQIPAYPNTHTCFLSRWSVRVWLSEKVWLDYYVFMCDWERQKESSGALRLTFVFYCLACSFIILCVSVCEESGFWLTLSLQYTHIDLFWWSFVSHQLSVIVWSGVCLSLLRCCRLKLIPVKMIHAVCLTIHFITMTLSDCWCTQKWSMRGRTCQKRSGEMRRYREKRTERRDKMKTEKGEERVFGES